MKKLIAILCLILIASSSSFAASYWVQQYSSAAAGVKGLNGVNFVNSSTGYAVGNSGVILKTTNGGASWSSIGSSNPWVSGTACFFTSDQTGFVSGKDSTAPGLGGVFKTTDGGSSWTEILQSPIPAGSCTYSDIFFAGTQNGWLASSTVPSAGLECMMTSNGGTNWTSIPAFYEKNSVFALPNTQNVWLAGIGGKIGYSTDGSNFTEVTDGTGNIYNDIHFVSATKGWAVGSNAGVTAGKISTSTNGGQSWASLATAPVATSFYSTWFLDQNTGWVCGTSSTIWKTTDGGAAWSDETTGTSLPIKDLYFVGQYDGWAVGGTDGTGNIILKYVTDPTAESVTPSSQYQGWSGNIVVTGTNFQAGITPEVTIAGGGSGVSCNLTRDSSTQVTLAVTIASNATTGNWNIKLINPDSGNTSFTFTVAAGGNGPAFSNITFDGALYADGSIVSLNTRYPKITADISDADGLSAAKINLKILINSSTTYPNLSSYYLPGNSTSGSFNYSIGASNGLPIDSFNLALYAEDDLGIPTQKNIPVKVTISPDSNNPINDIVVGRKDDTLIFQIDSNADVDAQLVIVGGNPTPIFVKNLKLYSKNSLISMGITRGLNNVVWDMKNLLGEPVPNQVAVAIIKTANKILKRSRFYLYN